MDFKRAIDVAEENARALLPGANELKLEGVIISGRDYEVTLSYYLTGKNPLELSGGKKDGNNLAKLATFMSTRREYKVFIVEKETYAFKGFKAYREK
jgi:hypothetical protein